MLKPFDAILLNKAIKGGGGVTPSGSISISANGTYDVSAFADAVVNVGGGEEDDGSMYLSAIIYTISNSLFSGTIRPYAFYKQSKVETVTMAKAAYVNTSAFQGCSKLALVDMPVCSYIAEGAFSQCTSLKSAYFASVKNVMSSAFLNCQALIDISMPMLQNIKPYAFKGCYNLQTVSLPALQTISAGAFADCAKLESVYLMGSSLASAIGGTGIFTNTPLSASSYLGYYGSIYVPASLYDSYKAAMYWSTYAERFVSVA